MTSDSSIFRNSQLAAAFHDDGFCSFNLFESHDIDVIKEVYSQSNHSPQQYRLHGVEYSFSLLELLANTSVIQLKELIQARLNQHFNGYEVMGCTFITPKSTPHATQFYQQDWNITYEDKYSFATCWVPLEEAKSRLGFIKGSHTLFSTIRSSNILSPQFAAVDIPEELCAFYPQKAGQCVAFNQAVFHTAQIDEDSVSPILAFIIKPVNAPIVHYIQNKESVQVYEIGINAFNQMLEDIGRKELPHSAVLTDTIRCQASPSVVEFIAALRSKMYAFRLFKDEQLHHEFNLRGYVRLNGLVGSQTIDRLRELYFQNFSASDGMFVTHHKVTDIEHNKLISASIYELLTEVLKEVFVNYKTLISHFAVKSGGGNGVFNFHQDWSIIQEQLFGVLHCWIPLHDTDEHNGTLTVLPHSHLVFHNYRSGHLPIHFTPIVNYPDHADVLCAKAGDVVFYHPALFHGSGENKSEQPRLAIVAGIAHNSASEVYYTLDGDQISMYELTPVDLFSRLDKLAQGELPLGNKISAVPFRMLPESTNEIEQRLKDNTVQKRNIGYAEV